MCHDSPLLVQGLFRRIHWGIPDFHPCSCAPFSGQTFCRGPEGGLPARVRNGAKSAEDGVTSLSVLPGGGAAFPPALGVGSTLGAPAVGTLSRTSSGYTQLATTSQLGSSCAWRKLSCGNLIWTAARNKEAKAEAKHGRLWSHHYRLHGRQVRLHLHRKLSKHMHLATIFCHTRVAERFIPKRAFAAAIFF